MPLLDFTSFATFLRNAKRKGRTAWPKGQLILPAYIAPVEWSAFCNGRREGFLAHHSSERCCSIKLQTRANGSDFLVQILPFHSRDLVRS